MLNISLLWCDLTFDACDFFIHTLDAEYGAYISAAYRNVQLVQSRPTVRDYEYTIHVTTYPDDVRGHTCDEHVRYVLHRFDPAVDDGCCVYLIPFVAAVTRGVAMLPTHLPGTGASRAAECGDPSRRAVPVFVVQGSLLRRRFDVLLAILELPLEFELRVIGRGHPSPLIRRICADERVRLSTNLGFDAFHRQFRDAFGILPCVSRATHPDYYSRQLTSSVSYGVGYGLRFVCDRDLAEAYGLHGHGDFYGRSEPAAIQKAFAACHASFFEQ